MTDHGKKTGRQGAVGFPNGSAARGLLSYRALTLTLVLSLTGGALIKLGLSWQKEHSSESTLSPTRQPTLGQVESAERPTSTAFRSQRHSFPQTQPTRDPKHDGSRPDPVAALHRLEDVLAQAGPRDKQTAATLKRFATNGDMAELRHLDRQDVVSLAAYLTSTVSAEEMRTLLHQYLGLSSGLTDLTKENLGATLVNIYDAVVGNRVEDVRPSVLMVTDGADADGRITGQADVIPSGTQKVYAVFENDHALAGLDQVLAVWRNPSDDRMVFTEFEPIRRGSAYNYVWLESKSGWPAGRYQVELFHPQAQSLLLASENFSVR